MKKVKIERNKPQVSLTLCPEERFKEGYEMCCPFCAEEEQTLCLLTDTMHFACVRCKTVGYWGWVKSLGGKDESDMVLLIKVD